MFCFRLMTAVFCMLVSGVGAVPVQPNILWITCEDMSPRLGCYGDRTVPTPHIDALAKEGVVIGYHNVDWISQSRLAPLSVANTPISGCRSGCGSRLRTDLLTFRLARAYR